MAVGSQKTQSLLSLDRERNAPLFLNYGSQAVRVLVGILLFLTPFYFLTAVKEFSFYLSILIVLGLSLVFKPKIFSFESPLNLSLLLFVSWACLNLFFALNKENSLIDVFGHLLKYLVTYYLVVNFFSSPRLFRQLSWVLILSATVFSYGAFIYFYLILGNPLSTLFRIHNYVYGYFHFWTVFASLLSIQLLFEDRAWRRKVLLFLCLGGMFLITLLSQTRSALIAIAVGLVIYFLKNKGCFFSCYFLEPFPFSRSLP